MNTTLWIVLVLAAWVLVPLPLAVLVGRAFAGGRHRTVADAAEDGADAAEDPEERVQPRTRDPLTVAAASH